jgi:hypothetical protein
MPTIILAVISLAALVVDAIVWNQYYHGTATATAVIPLHLVATGFLSLAVSLSMRNTRLSTKVTLLVFLFLLSSLLPVVGIVAVSLFALILRTAAGDGSNPEDSLIIGNHDAVAARRESREEHPHLLPFCEELRNADFTKIEQMIHGLKFMKPVRKILPLLLRFQNDARSNLQFAAQGVIYSEFETREMQIKELHARIKADSRALEPRLALAEVFLSMAEWTPPGDSTARVYQEEALKNLQEVGREAPYDARRLLLEIQAHIALQRPAAALALLESNDRHLAGHPSAEVLRMEALHQKGDYAALARIAAKADSQNPDIAEAIHFWNQPNPAKS